MMEKLGISVFFGMGQTVSQNMLYLKLARECGYSELFTSLHIPECDHGTVVSEARQLLFQAGALGFDVTADVSAYSWEVLGFRPSELKQIGITRLRIDFGLNPKQIAELAEITDLGIQINASTCLERDLSVLLSIGLNPGSLSAGHNFYPRPETGLSFELFVQRSTVFVSAEIPVSAFVPSPTHPRGPIFAGLPTVESHRYMSPQQAATQFLASGLLHSLFFSDPLVSEKELLTLAQLPKANAGPIFLRVRFNSGMENVKSTILCCEHSNRLDASACVVRSHQSRNLCTDTIYPKCNDVRRRGDLTLDNIEYGRYMGELQIVSRDLPADFRVNVVGRIIDEDLHLLDCLTPGRLFCLREVKTE